MTESLELEWWLSVPRGIYCVVSTFFPHKYTKVGQRREGECRSMSDLVMVEEDMLRGVYDVKIVYGLDMDLRILIVLCKVNVLSINEMCEREWERKNTKEGRFYELWREEEKV